MISKCYLIEPFTCNENDSLADTTKKLMKYAQRHIYVVSADFKPIGILSISDILNKVVAEGKNVGELKAKDVMTKEILVYDDSEDVKKPYKAMSEKGVISCAITQNGKMIGMLSLKEALKCVTDPKMIS